MTREKAESNFNRNWKEMLKLQKGKTDWAREEMMASVKGVYASELRDACISLEAQIKAKDEEIKVLECRAYHAEGYISDLHNNPKDKKFYDKKARSIVAMLFWEWRRLETEGITEEAFAARNCFYKAYALIWNP